VSSGTTLATPRGHTTISSRAMDHVISAVAADVLGIAPSDVSVTVSEADDEISLTVRAPNAVIAGAQETVTDSASAPPSASSPAPRSAPRHSGSREPACGCPSSATDQPPHDPTLKAIHTTMTHTINKTPKAESASASLIKAPVLSEAEKPVLTYDSRRTIIAPTVVIASAVLPATP
jgi:hypothetical protein